MYNPIGKKRQRKCRARREFLKITTILMFLSWCIIWIIFSIYFSDEPNPVQKVAKFLGIKSEPLYLVNSTKCQIINLDPFNEDAKKFFRPENYQPCTKQPLLTYVTNKDNVVTLHVDEKAAPSYYTKNIICCYSNITRKESAVDPDNAITSTECEMFKSKITLYYDTVYVRCFNKEERDIIYENIHTTFLINDHVRAKMTNTHPKKQISVLLIGIDSVSRLNFIRALPKTYNYVERNGWIPLKGYNKIGDNTLPNLIAILTGSNSRDINDVCKPAVLETFDQCPMLWDDYDELGYITSYAEDECWMSTFNYNKRGFIFPPTDFYFRPYMLASEKLRTKKNQGLTYCSGPESSGERILNLTKEFGVTFKEYPHFGLFWMNTFSHNQINTVSGMDEKIKESLEVLAKERVLEHSVVIFFSDHGIRFGGMRQTDSGWLEERLPFIYVSFPTWFKETFKREYNNFKVNSARLTSPYDLHMTLQDLLYLSGHNYIITQSSGCSTCKSLFEEIDVERSCEEAGIEQHWCACPGYTSIDLDKNLQNKVSTYVLNEIYKIMASHEEGWMCARYFVNNISTSISRKFSYSENRYLLVRLETVPKAIFESTVSYGGEINDLNFSISGTISRLDSYFPTSNCVTNSHLRKYCYCLR